MAMRPTFLLLLLLTAALAATASAGIGPGDASWGLAERDGDGGLDVDDDSSSGASVDSDLVGDLVDEEEEMGMESESGRRMLAAKRKFISYGALKKNQVPCNRRGQSYYNCNKHGRANPYHRACTAITRCARDLH